MPADGLAGDVAVCSATTRPTAPVCSGDGIVILATQRSGSTLLCDALHRSGFGRGEEHMLNLVRPWEIDSFQSGDYAPEMARRFVASEFREMGLHNGCFCTKVMANYLHSFCGFLQRSAAVPDVGEQAALLGAAFRGCAFVFLFRPNRIAQAISRVMAGHTGICHVAGESAGGESATVDEDYNQAVIFRASDIHTEIESIRREEATLRTLQRQFEGIGVPTLFVLYDGQGFALGQTGRVPASIGAALRKVQGRGNSSASVRKMANRHSLMFEIVFRSFRNRAAASEHLSRDDVVGLTVAALSDCGGFDPDWVATQTEFILRNSYA